MEKKLEGKCGGPGKDSVPSIYWDFVLTGGAPCIGYIVQKVVFLCHWAPCADKPCNEPKCPLEGDPPKKAEYWEAWKVAKGAKRMTKRRETEKGTVFTDSSNGICGDKTCGKSETKGEVRFYCMHEEDVANIPEGQIGHTGDLGDIDDENEASGWLTGKPGGGALQFGDGSLYCSIGPGGLPATKEAEKAPFWGDKAVNEEGSERRSFSIEWNCCEGMEKVCKADADPK